MWTPSNSEQMIPREHIFGTLRGVDFGPKVFVIARAEKPMLLWLGGHSWSNNGFSRYSQSHLTIIRDRQRMDGWRNYTSLEPHGGRLTISRLELARDKICEVLGDYWNGITHAVTTRQTLIIEGGGEVPQPHPSLGWEVHSNWRERSRLSSNA